MNWGTPTLPDIPLWPNAWICGQCGDVTDVSHWYRDRASGELMHLANDERRAKAADQCGARFDDTYESPTRCTKRHDHVERHDELHSNIHVRWTSRDHGHIEPPSDEPWYG